MMSRKRNAPYEEGKYSRYKGRYFLAFYDKDGENYVCAFNNVREILVYQGKEITRQNVNYLNLQIYRALNFYNHRTTLLDGRILTIWLVDDFEDDDYEDIEIDESIRKENEQL